MDAVFKNICHFPPRVRSLKGSAACQHGGDMLVRTAGDTKIPVKGRAGVYIENIHLNNPNYIKIL